MVSKCGNSCLVRTFVSAPRKFFDDAAVWVFVEIVIMLDQTLLCLTRDLYG